MLQEFHSHFLKKVTLAATLEGQDFCSSISQIRKERPWGDTGLAGCTAAALWFSGGPAVFHMPPAVALERDLHCVPPCPALGLCQACYGGSLKGPRSDE